MTDKNWDAEMQKIDRAMGKVSDESLARAAPAAKPAGSTAAGPGTSGFGVYARLSLAAALGIGIVFWPYSARCGVGLAAYLASVGVLAGAGLWTAIWTWRHRSPRGHILALLLLLWGLLLVAMEVLPRTGYAVPTENHPAQWTCS